MANRNIKAGEIILSEAPLVLGPAQTTIPVCLGCYVPVDGSYKCPRSGWPLCGPTCSKAIAKNPEVVVPSQCQAQFEIEEYFKPSYMYECIIVLRALLLQKQSPAKYKALMSLESHIEERRGTEVWVKTQENVIDIMKKSLGIMVFEAICPELDFSDETIQKIQGILDTNKKEIRLSQSDVEALYATACLLEHSCRPNVKITFEKDYSVAESLLVLPWSYVTLVFLDHSQGWAGYLRGRTHLHDVQPRHVGHCGQEGPSVLHQEVLVLLREVPGCHGVRFRYLHHLRRRPPHAARGSARH